MAILMGVLMLPLIGFLALGVEAGFWALTKSSLQHAADSAAISAALNGASNYDVEAKAVAALMGIRDGDDVSVSNTATCPDGGGATCYSVTIARKVPLMLAQVVGFRGDGNGHMHLAATAVASPSSAVVCALAMNDLTATGGDLGGCNSMANNSAQCDGQTGIGVSYAHTANNGCGARRVAQPILLDPYPALADSIPAAQACGSGVSPPLSGTLTLNSGNNVLCGPQRLGGNLIVQSPLGGSSVLAIQNGGLDLAGHTLQSSFGSALTILFTGSASSVTHAPTGGGVLDITPPTIGPWAGVALAQDPSVTTGVDFTLGAWNVTGLIYAKHATINWVGSIDRSTNGGKACSVVVANNLQITAGAGIAATNIGQCDRAGLIPPRLPGANARLVE